MTSNVKLLPLPEYFQRDLTHMTWEGLTQAAIDYAHACVEANTEALRAEVDALRSRLEDTIRDRLNEQARAERLAEALRDYFDDPHADAEATLRKLATLDPDGA